MLLKQRKELVESQWDRFLHKKAVNAPGIPQRISASWSRSQTFVPTQTSSVRLEDPHETEFRWHESPIHDCAQRELAKLMDIVSEGELVAAISDATGRLLWTYASQHMQDRAGDVNFIAGGQWGEQSAGTNAVGLCLITHEPVTVFSAEHFRSALHDWVCYAAPIIHPQTGALVGTLDLSSTWERHTPLGQAAIEQMAKSIAQNLPDHQPQAELELYMLGQPRVIYKGAAMHLSLRHCEILCLLALNPRGLSLDALHAALYGDEPVTKSTLKSEISTLRSLLGGSIASRPYRLDLGCRADFVDLWSAINAKRFNLAFSLYQGSLLTSSNSPEVEQWRHCIDAIMSKSLNNCDDFGTMLKQCHLDAGELVRERLLELADY
ncbi:helix-turn-helix domain-containing protein [Leucothrix mucor]|uniref:helix-turn-helix domain-containing protein n=1 Tax=Leucothrix mucor TaxID=45248 RepID=UPI0003B6B642|nr:helix-turn-helix domain-containing protein [Leucothrix mucor]